MLRSFRSWASDDPQQEEEEDAGGDFESQHEDPAVAERRSLLDVEAPLEGDEGIISGLPNSGSNNTTTGMNPQDDLDQAYPDLTAVNPAALPPAPPLLHGNNSSSHSNSVTITDPLIVPTTSPSAPTRRKQPVSLVAEDVNGAGIAASTVVSRRKGQRRRRARRQRSNSTSSEKPVEGISQPGPLDAVCSVCLRTMCFDRTMVRNTLSCMNVMARVLVWASFLALGAAVVWYSYELFNNGTEKHRIAWFSAGAFVLLGFPLSIGSIVGHLSNYNQPHVQCYIVRILWMVPMYSIESWLCLRYHEKAIYIETLRDFYESFVLYSFFQFLIEVLGGEEALILMLKDKSPTRGSHMWGLQWCVKPWLMGQPVRRSNDGDDLKVPGSIHNKSLKRVHWKSPFFVQCKFGVLQYVLLKFVCSSLAMILEAHKLYKEGDFTPKGGYLYICIVTNISQCWALYCLILFYYATHNELGPIRPVGKFLSVKALVFFTWWQSVAISVLYQMDMLPHYQYSNSDLTVEMSPEDVAKGIQDYLICIEMFFAAIAHTLVFPHTEYSPQEVQARARALNQSAINPSLGHQRKRMGRHSKFHTSNFLRNHHYDRDDKSAASKNSGSKSSNITGGDRSFFDLEMTTLASGGAGMTSVPSWEEPALTEHVDMLIGDERARTASVDSMNSDYSPMVSPAKSGMNDWASSPSGPYTDAPPGWDTPSSDSQPDYNKSTHPALQSHAPTSLMQPNFNNRNNGTIEEGVEYSDGATDDELDELRSSDGSYFSDEVLEEPDVPASPQKKHGFIRAFMDSAIPRDLRDNTVGIVKGDYVVEKKTLLHHATTSDQYDLFSQARRNRGSINNPGKHK